MKIVIIKLGALGDVIRTTPIAVALKSRYPDSQILWITRKESVPLLEGQEYIERVSAIPFKTDETFDLLYNFDIEKEATDLAGLIKAGKKYGFGSDGGYPVALNSGAEYYLNTVFDDQLKKTNKRTYQEMMFETAELSYAKEPCVISLNKRDRLYAETFAQKNKIKTEKLIGIHMGASTRWPSKAWHPDCIAEFVRLAKKRGYEIILFGGESEQEKLSETISKLEEEGLTIYRQEPNTNTKQFAALVGLCRYIVCSDSLCLHVALALKKKTAGLFFVTSPEEVEGYGLLKKMVSPKLHEFFPEKSDIYDEALTKSIDPEDVLDALESIK